MRAVTVAILTGGLMLTGACASSGTAMHRAQQQCLIGGVVLTGIGAVLGNNLGDGDAADGALVGAAAGVGLCAVLTAMASEEDQRRIREAEYAAREAGERREETYRGADGRRRSIVVETSAAPARTWTVAGTGADAGPTSQTDICRYSQTTLSVEGKGVGALEPELVCRNPTTRAWEVQRG